MGLEAALHTPLRLRAGGRAHLDPQLGHGAGELRQGLDVAPLLLQAGFPIDRIDGVVIDVEGHRPSIACQVHRGRPHQRHRVLGGDELPVEQPARGVIHIQQQDTAGPAALEPVVLRAVHLNQHADAGAPRPPGPMPGFLPARPPQPRLDQRAPQGGHGEGQAMPLPELLRGKRRPEVGIRGVHEGHGALDQPRRQAPVRRPPP